ncbi:MAG: hypothetical protein KDC98_20495 [Planctomycetes bacterium]|nr:hypothetical protein [Planctomycetota bacterium]
MTAPLARTVLALPLLAAALAGGQIRAQALQLDVTGGSMPGTFSFDMHPGAYPFEFGAVIPSFVQGPTALSLFDPNDPRSLDIGTDLLSLAWVGYLGLDGHMRVGPLSMPALPAFQDLPIFFQGVTIWGGVRIVGRISNPNVMRLGLAGAFRDRFVSFYDPRAFATVLPRADGRWMVVGGASGALLAQTARDTTSIHDPFTDAPEIGPMMTAPRSMHTQTLLDDGRWLLTGGVNNTNDPQATCEVYDPTTDTFTAVAPMNVPRTGHTATKLQDGRVFVAGGLQAMTTTPTALSAIRDATAAAEIYDPVANTWTNVPGMSVPRAAHAAVLRPDGKVLLAGGVSWNPVIIIGWLPTVRSSCDLYDPATNTMSAGPSMNHARSFLEPLDLGSDRWLLAGGITALTLTSPGTPTATAEIYDAAANTWTAVGSMASARAFHKGWALGNGQFLLAGGADGDILTPVPSADTEIFSLTGASFSAGPAMTIPRAAPAAYLTPQGQVHLFGGGTTNNTITSGTEFYYF